MAELAKLKLIRGAQRTWLTKKINLSTTLLKATAIEESLIVDLTALKSAFAQKIDQIQALNSQVHELLEDEPALTTDIEDCEEREGKAHGAIIRIERFLKENVHDKQLPTIPEQHLLSFSGKPEQFTTFWELFETTIHNNPHLTNVQKFAYLRPLLTDKANECVAGIRQSHGNYVILVDTLKQAFAKPELVIDSHLHALTNLSPVTKSNDFGSLRRQHDIIQSHISSLSSLGVLEETYSKMAMPLIIKSLPTRLQFKLTELLEDPAKRNLKAVMTALLNNIEIGERCNSLTNKAGDSNSSKTDKYPTKTHTSKTQYYNGNRKSDFIPQSVLSSTTGNKIRCSFCNGEHYANACTVYATPDARYQRLRSLKACLNCARLTKPPHFARDCRSNSRCRTCNKKHHTTIHDSINSNNQNLSNQNRGAEGGGSDQTSSVAVTSDCESEENTLEQNVVLASKRPSSKVLLQTALVEIYNPVNNKSVERRILLDSASQGSWIEDEVAKELDLVVLGQQKFNVNVFGQRKPVLKVGDIVEFEIKKRDFNLKMSALTSPHVCNPLKPLQANDQIMSDLNKLMLADPQIMTTDSLPIGLLCGADVYWSIMTGKMKQLSSGPMAVYTPVGCIISGPVNESIKTHNCSCQLEPISLYDSYVSTLSNITDDVDTSKDVDQVLNDLLEKFWSLNTVGILPDEQEVVYSKFKETINYNEKLRRYTCELPFMPNVWIDLPDNKEAAIKRLDNMLRKLTPSSCVNDP